MKRSTLVIAVLTGTVLALPACSGGTGAASTSISAPVGPPAAAAGVTSAGSFGASDSERRSITAQGIGTVTGTPDVLTIGLGVETRSASAADALAENSRRATDVITVLTDNGVAPVDLQTSQLSVNPAYGDNGQITGYQVTNMITAKLRDVAGAGAVIDAVGTAAGNAVRVQYLRFSIDDDSALRAAARADAVRRAQAQAKQLADAAGVPLGAVHSITENAAVPIGYDRMAPAAAAGAAGAAGAAVPIEAGSQDLSVVVQVVYDIAQ